MNSSRSVLSGLKGTSEQGSNLVETALVLFLLALLLVGVADIGRAFHSYITITNAAREGARRATRLPQQTGVDDLIKDAVVAEAANSGVDLDEGSGDARITIGPELTLRSAHAPLTVTVQYTMTSFIGGLIGLEELPMHTNVQIMLFEDYEP